MGGYKMLENVLEGKNALFETGMQTVELWFKTAMSFKMPAQSRTV